MNTKFGIAERVGNSAIVRTDLPAFASVFEAEDFIVTELCDFSLSNHYITPIEVSA